MTTLFPSIQIGTNRNVFSSPAARISPATAAPWRAPILTISQPPGSRCPRRAGADHAIGRQPVAFVGQRAARLVGQFGASPGISEAAI